MKLHNLLPARLEALLRFHQGHWRSFNPWGFAMNGQTARLEGARQILYRCGVQQIVETGTFRGVTTEWLAQFGMPVITVESHPMNYAFSQRRLKPLKNVQIKNGDSVSVLQQIAPTLSPSAPTLFYLDAHWEGSLPVREELEVILPHFSRAIVLVDDFEVPGDPNYAYDDYGQGKSLTEASLKTWVPAGTELFYPSVPGAQETGARRGCVVFSNDAAITAELGKIEFLRKG